MNSGSLDGMVGQIERSMNFDGIEEDFIRFYQSFLKDPNGSD
jgi:hypothetical protein